MVITIEELTSAHDVAGFDCGNPRLNQFVRELALPNAAEVSSAKTYVAVEPGGRRVAGYHSISTGVVRFAKVPEPAFLKRQNLHYPVPTAHLGRLAVDNAYRGRRIGELLLLHAMGCAVRAAEHIAISVLDVEAIDDKARDFYLRYGFRPLKDEKRHLYMRIETARLACEAIRGA